MFAGRQKWAFFALSQYLVHLPLWYRPMELIGVYKLEKSESLGGLFVIRPSWVFFALSRAQEREIK
jgi:hypothetical protein